MSTTSLDSILKNVAKHKQAKAFSEAEAGLSLTSNALHFIPPERYADGSIRHYRPEGWYKFPNGHCNHDKLYSLPCSTCHRSEAEAAANVVLIFAA